MTKSLRTICLLLLTIQITAWVNSLQNLNARSAIKMQLSRVVTEPLPKLYVYDHCPFCVRVRLAFGLKNIKHELCFLANDDVSTPTSLVGKKIAPIYSMDGEAMPESLDIIAKVDSDPRFGPISLFKPFSPRTDLKSWQEKAKEANSLLQRTRYVMVPLPEFHQQDARNAFVNNHPLPGYTKDTWKELPKEEQWKKYSTSYFESLKLIEKTNAALTELDSLIYSPNYCTEGGLSLDDIDLWSRLRSLTLVKGIMWPAKLRKYMDYFSKAADIPLYDSMAC